MSKFGKLLGFDPEAKKTNVKTEIIAGIVTFLTMCYILTVNPDQITSFAPRDAMWSSIFIATALGAIIGTLLMAFLSKMPLAQASGMGLNSMFGTIVGGVYGFAFSMGQTFLMVLISGVIFLLLSVISVKGKTFRELVFDGMPVAVRGAISVGIGLFIAYIGFQNAGIIVANQYTQVGLVDFTNWGNQLVQWNGVMWIPELVPMFTFVATGSLTFYAAAKTAMVALIGLLLIALLDKFKVKGAVIIGILGATIVGIPFGVTDLSVLAGNNPGISWKFWENFANYFTIGETSAFGSFVGAFKTGFPAGSLFTVIMLVITMCMIDMFDTMGTIVGCCGGNRILSDENNKPYNYDKIMISDSIATCAGAMLGTSTVTTFVESGSGVAAGGRTGLTALVTAIMFFIAMFAMPIFATIPSAATASALIYVGVLMMKNNIKIIDFSDSINAVSAFLTIVIMPLSYSITKGIGIGMIVYTVLSILAYVIEIIIYAFKKDKTVTNEAGETVAIEKPKFKVSVIAIIVTVLFLIYFFVPTDLLTF
ncbi:MAG: NCS2 family permease [Clostridiales bacterium]|nr:NCS2 family permease [Clostridiales bacterium]